MADTNVVIFGKKIDELARSTQFHSLYPSILKPCPPWISLENIKKIKRFDITRERVVKADSPVPVGPMSLREISSV